MTDTRNDNLRESPAATTAEPVWTVSALNRAVRELFEQTLMPVWVRGEVSNLTLHSSGHVYFSLKDAQSQIAAVFFRGVAAARQMQLRAGLEVEAWGRVSLYEPRGQYQFVVSRLRPFGLGALQRRFEDLQRRLRAEGLFDAARKRPIPVLPRCVGVVTSPQGAAIQDFMQILGRRFATVHLRICPASVQGERAAPEITAAIRYLNATRACDVIVVTRGGGSLEDLWPFNEELVVRAVAASAIPVISAVGHETDFTLCDEAADLRVPTPSAAAELVIARKSELLERVHNARRRLRSGLDLALGAIRRRVERAAASAVFREPATLVRAGQQRVDELGLRLAVALQRAADRAKARVELCAGRLQAMNPRQVLARGYAILVPEATGSALCDAAATAPGARVRGILGRGELRLTVDEVHADPPAERTTPEGSVSSAGVT